MRRFGILIEYKEQSTTENEEGFAFRRSVYNGIKHEQTEKYI